MRNWSCKFGSLMQLFWLMITASTWIEGNIMPDCLLRQRYLVIRIIVYCNIKLKWWLVKIAQQFQIEKKTITQSYSAYCAIILGAPDVGWCPFYTVSCIKWMHSGLRYIQCFQSYKSIFVIRAQEQEVMLNLHPM